MWCDEGRRKRCSERLLAQSGIMDANIYEIERERNTEAVS